MADDRIEIEVVLDDGSVVRGFQRVKREGQNTGRDIGKSFGRGIAGIRNQILALGAALGSAFAGRAIIQAAARQEEAVNRLNTALRLAGSFSDEASKGIQDFASELQRVTTVGDETTLELFSLARTFTQTNEEAQRLTKAAVELSAATGLTLDSAVKNLGKTFGGLTGELGEVLPQLRGLGPEALKSGAALDFVLDRFGGAAEAQVRTFNGAIAQAGNNFGDFLEKLGGLATSSPATISLVNTISETFVRLGDAVERFAQQGDPFGDLVEGTIRFALAVNKFLVVPLELAFNVIKTVFDGIVNAINGALNTVAENASKLVSFFAPNSELANNLKTFAQSSALVFDESSQSAQDSLNSIFNFDFAASSEEFLVNLRNTVAAAEGIVSESAARQQETVKGTTGRVIDITAQAQAALDATIKQGVAAIGGALARGENAFAAFGKVVLSIIGDLLINVGFAITGIGNAIESLKIALGNLTGGVAIAAGLALVALGGALKALGGGPGLGAAGATTGGSVPPETVTGGPEITEEEEIERSTAVTVNVEGTVLDPVGVGTQIAELLSDVTDSNDIAVNV